MRRYIGMFFYVLGIASVIIFGSIYAFTDDLLPHHQELLGSVWVQTDYKVQLLMLSFKTYAGLAGLIIGFILAVLLLIPFRQKAPWANWLLLGAGCATTLPLAYIAFRIGKLTEFDTPWFLAAIMTLFFILGFLLSLKPSTHIPTNCT